jgi:fluoroquinolone transport system permease protein
VTRAPARLVSRLRWDLVLQVRQGFLLAGAVVAGTWVLLAARWVGPEFVSWAPALALGNLGITSFYFIAGIVLFERGEGSLQGLWLTPLRPGEYLASKVASLALFAVGETVVILAACFGAALPWTALCLGMIAMSAIYTLIGILMVLRYDGISEFLVPSVGVMALLQLPALAALEVWDHPLLWLLPMRPPLLVLEWAVAPEKFGVGALALAIGGSILWIALLGAASGRALHRFAAGLPAWGAARAGGAEG